MIFRNSDKFCNTASGYNHRTAPCTDNHRTIPKIAHHIVPCNGGGFTTVIDSIRQDSSTTDASGDSAVKSCLRDFVCRTNLWKTGHVSEGGRRLNANTRMKLVGEPLVVRKMFLSLRPAYRNGGRSALRLEPHTGK